GQFPGRVSRRAGGEKDRAGEFLRRQPRTGTRGADGNPADGAFRADLHEARSQSAQGGRMTEKSNVVPLLGDDVVDERDNPARRLHMAEARRMAEAIVFASAEPVTEKALAARLP